MKTYPKSLREIKAEGRAEGKAEGKAEILEHQLATRFGPLEDGVRTRLRTAGDAELGRWAQRVLTARSVDEVFGTR